MPKRIQRRSAGKAPRSLTQPLLRTKLRRHRINELFDKEHGRWPEMTQYAHDGSTHELRLFQWNPTTEEIAAVLSGTVELGFEDYSELCYLTSRLSENAPWSRTPIARWLLPNPPCPLPAANSPLRIVLVNAADGTVQAIGTVELDSPIVSRLLQLFTSQASHPSGYLTMDDLLRTTRSVEPARNLMDRRGKLTASARTTKRTATRISNRQPQSLSL